MIFLFQVITVGEPQSPPPKKRKVDPSHDDVIKWKHFPRYWPFVRGIHRSPVSSPRKGQWRGALMFSLICAWINGWINNREAGDLRRHRAHYDVIVIAQAVSRLQGMYSIRRQCILLAMCGYKRRLCYWTTLSFVDTTSDRLGFYRIDFTTRQTAGEDLK